MRILVEKKKLILSEGKRFTYNLLPVGKFFDPRYNWLDFSVERLTAIADRFNAKIPAYEIFINKDHWDDSKTASIDKAYFIEGEGLYIEGVILDEETFKEFDYMSVELEPYIDKINGGEPQETLMGAALTNRPANPFVQKIQLSENAEFEIITQTKEEQKKEKIEEETPMTAEEKKKMDELEAENKRLAGEQIKLSEKNRADKIEAQKSVWLAEGIAPATIAIAEKFLRGQVKEGGIHLSEGKQVDLVDAFVEVFKGFEKINLSEVGKGRQGKTEFNLVDIANGLKK